MLCCVYGKHQGPKQPAEILMTFVGRTNQYSIFACRKCQKAILESDKNPSDYEIIVLPLVGPMPEGLVHYLYVSKIDPPNLFKDNSWES